MVEYFLKKIYTTTGILLLKNNAGGHGIIPNNLREIHQFYALLNNLDTVDLYDCILGENQKDKKNKLKSNLEVFENFLFNSYFKKNIPLKYLKVLDEFNRIDSDHLNIFVFQKIRELFMKEIEPLNSDDKSDTKKSKGSAKDTEPDIFKIVPEDYCIGDVLQSLNHVNLYNDSITQKFVECIKILYSIRILKLIFIEGNWKETRIVFGGRMHGGQFSQFVYDDRKVDPTILKELPYKYYLQFFILRYNLQDKTRSEALFEPAYKHIFNPGSSKHYELDLSSFIVNLLDLDLINERVNNNKFDPNQKAKIEEWRKEYVAAIPVWSLDFVDNFFKKVPRRYDLDSKGRGGAKPRQKAAYVFNTFVNICREIISENEFIFNIQCRNQKSLAEVFQSTLESIIGEDNFDGEFVTYLANIGSVPFDIKNVQNLQPMVTDGITLTSRIPRAIRIFDKLYYVTVGYEILTKTLAALIGRDKGNYEILKDKLKTLKIGESENSDKQQKLNLPHDVFPEFIYIMPRSSNDQNLELCKSAFEVIGSDYRSNFEVYCELESSVPDEEIRDETK